MCIEGDADQLVAFNAIKDMEGVAYGTIRKALTDNGLIKEWRLKRWERMIEAEKNS